jgi:endonuclease/exonuclease/phosphatase family metal-dependent hydrolase
LILAGDFNDWKKMSCDRLASSLGMTEAFKHCHGKLLPTFPAKLPVLSLDRIYVRNLRVKDAWVHTGKPWSTLSDHLPLSAELALP